jgi:hypothetical protein
MKLNSILFTSVGLAVASLAATASAADPALYILGKCVDVPSASTTNGTGIQIYDCNGGANQEWEFRSDGTVRPNYDTNKCLDLPGWETADHTPIQIYDCNGGSNQQWALESDGTLRGYGGKCVDDPSASTSDGTFFQYYDCNGGSNQHFTLAPAVTGVILTRWQSLGGPTGLLGLPTSDEGPWGNGTIRYFQNGYIAQFNGTTVVSIGGTEIILEIPTSNVAGADSVSLTQPIVLSVFSNGGYEFTGTFYNSESSWNLLEDIPGSIGDAVAIAWKAADGTLFTFTHSGKTSSTTQSARTDSWNTPGNNASIAADWNNFVNWSFTSQANVGVSLSNVLSDVETASGPVGKVISVL